jgi:ATP-dependent protease ClpP protease subunit
MEWICGAIDINTEESVIRSYNNEITFASNVNAKSINDLIKIFDETINTIKTNNISSMSKMNTDKIVIVLYIDSPGGKLKDCFKFIDYIKIIKKIHNIKLITVGMGLVASAGTLMHIVGDEKYITENSQYMIHELYSGSAGKYTECLSWIKAMKDIHEKLLNIYLTNNTKIDKEKLEALLKNESWFTSSECIEHGFVDGIYGE